MYRYILPVIFFTYSCGETKQEQTTKESKPIELWIYAGIIFGLIAFILIFKKLTPNL